MLRHSLINRDAGNFELLWRYRNGGHIKQCFCSYLMCYHILPHNLLYGQTRAKRLRVVMQTITRLCNSVTLQFEACITLLPPVDPIVVEDERLRPTDENRHSQDLLFLLRISNNFNFLRRKYQQVGLLDRKLNSLVPFYSNSDSCRVKRDCSGRQRNATVTQSRTIQRRCSFLPDYASGATANEEQRIKSRTLSAERTFVWRGFDVIRTSFGCL